jgi:hypothetical protein
MYLLTVVIMLSTFLVSKAVSDYSGHFMDSGYIHHERIEINKEQAKIILKQLGLFSERIASVTTMSNIINLIHEIRVSLAPLKDETLNIHGLTEYIFEISGPLRVMPYTKKATQYMGFLDSLLKYIHYIGDLMGIDTRLPLNVSEVEDLGDNSPSPKNLNRLLEVAKIRKLVAAIHERKMSLIREASANPLNEINPLKERILEEVLVEKLLNQDLVISKIGVYDDTKPDFLNQD